MRACLQTGKKGEKHEENSRTGVGLAPGPHLFPGRRWEQRDRLKSLQEGTQRGKEDSRGVRKKPELKGEQRTPRDGKTTGLEGLSPRQHSHPHNQWLTLPCTVLLAGTTQCPLGPHPSSDPQPTHPSNIQVCPRKALLAWAAPQSLRCWLHPTTCLSSQTSPSPISALCSFPGEEG